MTGVQTCALPIWALPPLENGPDLLVLATELAGLGGPDLPTQVSAVDSFESVTDAPQRSLGVTARLETPLAALFRGDDTNWMCDALDRSRRTEEHTSELQSRTYFVCRLLPEKKNYFYLISYFSLLPSNFTT